MVKLGHAFMSAFCLGVFGTPKDLEGWQHIMQP
jgi:hypothetical protein